MGAVIALLYLHGLASSPKGRKRAMLEKRFEADGWKVVAPDLNVPSFLELSFAEMCAEAFVTFAEAKPRVVVGSSLGALVALALADMLRSASPPLVLVAPALGFGERWKAKLPEGDALELFHHGEGKPLPIRRAFFEEMSRVDVDEEPPPVPVSIVMGTRDESVPFEQVAERWARWESVGPPRCRLALPPGRGRRSRPHRVRRRIERAVRERLAR